MNSFNCLDFYKMLERNVKPLCQSITYFEISTIGTFIWENMTPIERDTYNPSNNIITPAEIELVVKRFRAYIKWRNNFISENHTIVNTFETIESNCEIGKIMIDGWLNLSKEEIEYWRSI